MTISPTARRLRGGSGLLQSGVSRGRGAMRARVTDDGGVELVGRLDVRGAAAAREALPEALARGSGRLLVDLSGVELLDATGLGVLVAAHRGPACRTASWCFCERRPPGGPAARCSPGWSRVPSRWSAAGRCWPEEPARLPCVTDHTMPAGLPTLVWMESPGGQPCRCRLPRPRGRLAGPRPALGDADVRRALVAPRRATRCSGATWPRARPACRSPSTCPRRPATTRTTSWPAARSAGSACRWRTSATCARSSTASRWPPRTRR